MFERVIFACLSLMLALPVALGEGFCGKKCCQQKKVNGSTYFLAYESQDVHPNCKDGCIYTKENDQNEQLFCFRNGDLKVEECLNCKPLPGIFLSISKVNCIHMFATLLILVEIYPPCCIIYFN